MSNNDLERVIRLLPVVSFLCVGFVRLWRGWFERAFEEDLVPAWFLAVAAVQQLRLVVYKP